jgi:hypothetical protein
MRSGTLLLLPMSQVQATTGPWSDCSCCQVQVVCFGIDLMNCTCVKGISTHASIAIRYTVLCAPCGPVTSMNKAIQVCTMAAAAVLTAQPAWVSPLRSMLPCCFAYDFVTVLRKCTTPVCSYTSSLNLVGDLVLAKPRPLLLGRFVLPAANNAHNQKL